MVLIRHPAFLITTLLHCLLASSLPQYDWAQKFDTSKSSIPGGPLQTLYYNKVPERKITVTPLEGITPTWQYKATHENPELIVKNLLSYHALPGLNYDAVGIHQLPGRNTQYTTYKPELQGGVLNAAGFDYPSTPRMRHEDLVTTPYKPEPPSSVIVEPKNRYYQSTSPGIHAEDVLASMKPTSYQSYIPLVLRPTNFEYPPTNPAVFFINGPRKELENSSKLGYPGPNIVKPTKPDPYTKPGTGSKTLVELPPIPTLPMSVRRRTEIALMNTVSGSPGGSTTLLDSVRA